MSPNVEKYRHLYRRLQVVAHHSGRLSAKELLREIGGRSYGTTTPFGSFVHTDPRIERDILPRLEALWGTRKGDRSCPSN